MWSFPHEHVRWAKPLWPTNFYSHRHVALTYPHVPVDSRARAFALKPMCNNLDLLITLPEMGLYSSAPSWPILCFCYYILIIRFKSWISYTSRLIQILICRISIEIKNILGILIVIGIIKFGQLCLTRINSHFQNFRQNSIRTFNQEFD